MYQGRDGSDFYSCYNPIIHRTNYGPITCCANTGLSGDCFTWDLQPGTSITPEPSGSTTPAPGTPTPTPVYSPLTCAPINQTVGLKEIATVTANGGSGALHWLTEPLWYVPAVRADLPLRGVAGVSLQHERQGICRVELSR